MSSAAPPRVQALAQTPELNGFCQALEHFLETGEGANELATRAAALTAEAQQLELPPEHILYAMRVARCRGNRSRRSDERDRLESRRYTAAIRLLLQHYFGVPDSDIGAVGDITRARTVSERSFRAEVAVREVRDPASGETWTVRLVCEGYASDPGLEIGRREWLTCVAASERRFISPAPQEWLEWSDARLLSAIRVAPVDQGQEPS